MIKELYLQYKRIFSSINGDIMRHKHEQKFYQINKEDI